MGGGVRIMAPNHQLTLIIVTPLNINNCHLLQVVPRGSEPQVALGDISLDRGVATVTDTHGEYPL